MIKVTKYKAFDGTEFYVRNECIKYELQLDTVSNIMFQLEPLPEDEMKLVRFVNGKNYIQHDPEIFTKVKAELETYALETYGKERINYPYFVLDPLNRFLHTDNLCREYGQMYFKIEAENV